MPKIDTLQGAGIQIHYFIFLFSCDTSVQLGSISPNVCWRCFGTKLLKHLFIKGKHKWQTPGVTVTLLKQPLWGLTTCLWRVRTHQAPGLCVPLQLLKAHRAEEEDGVKQQQTEAQPAVQPPAVQMDAQNLSSEEQRQTSFNECCCWETSRKESFYKSPSKALRLWFGMIGSKGCVWGGLLTLRIRSVMGNRGQPGGGCVFVLTVRETEASSRITEYTRPLLLIVT